MLWLVLACEVVRWGPAARWGIAGMQLAVGMQRIKTVRHDRDSVNETSWRNGAECSLIHSTKRTKRSPIDRNPARCSSTCYASRPSVHPPSFYHSVHMVLAGITKREVSVQFRIGLVQHLPNCVPWKNRETRKITTCICADPGVCALKGVVLRPLAWWGCGYWGHGCLSVVSVIG